MKAIRTLHVALLAAFLVVPGWTPAAAASSPSLEILTANVMLLPLLSSPVTGSFANDKRVDLMAAPTGEIVDWLRSRDVVVLEELFDNVRADTLLSRLHWLYPNQTPIIGRSGGDWDDRLGSSGSIFEDGGVAILSKWPIVKKIEYLYADACGSDASASKGFAYAELDVHGSRVHVIGTHLQAGSESCSIGVRNAQLKEIRNFVLLQNIPADETVVYAGDFNIDRLNSVTEFQNMMSKLHGFSPSAFMGHPFTMDPVANDLAKFRTPNEPRQWLDYVIYDNTHIHQTKMTDTSLKVASPAWKAQDTTFHTYSDHFPLVGATDPPTFQSPLSHMPINDWTTITSSIAVSGLTNATAPTNLRVFVDIKHTFIGDLRVKLIAPNGQQWLLHDREGGSADDINTPYSIDASAVTNSNGAWSLTVEDLAGGDTGELTGWSLTF